MNAKPWLDPFRLEDSSGFGRSELQRLRHLIEENKGLFQRQWNEYFTN
jgi:hypothetical protein